MVEADWSDDSFESTGSGATEPDTDDDGGIDPDDHDIGDPDDHSVSDWGGGGSSSDDSDDSDDSDEKSSTTTRDFTDEGTRDRGDEKDSTTTRDTTDYVDDETRGVDDSEPDSPVERNTPDNVRDRNTVDEEDKSDNQPEEGILEGGGLTGTTGTTIWDTGVTGDEDTNAVEEVRKEVSEVDFPEVDGLGGAVLWVKVLVVTVAMGVVAFLLAQLARIIGR